MRPWQTINQVCRRLKYFLILPGAADTSGQVFHNHGRLGEHPRSGARRVPAPRACQIPSPESSLPQLVFGLLILIHWSCRHHREGGTLARIGYARVSTRNKHSEAQRERLEAAGCTRIFTDKGASGARASRPEWDKCLDRLGARRHARLHQARPDRPVGRQPHGRGQHAPGARCRPGVPGSADRHHVPAGPSVLHHPGRVRRVRARPHPRAHQRRPGRHHGPRPERRTQAPADTRAGAGRQGSPRGRAVGEERSASSSATASRSHARRSTGPWECSRRSRSGAW